MPETLVAAIQRIDQLGGRLEFDAQGVLTGVDMTGDRLMLRDNDVAVIAVGLPQLAAIRLAGGEITDAGIAYLLVMPNLTEVALRNTQLSNVKLARLCEMPRITALDLRGCTELNDAGLTYLHKAKQLTALKLRGPAIKGTTLDVVREIASLESFTIEESPITADDLKKLKDRPLKELAVFRCLMIDDSALSILAGWSDLRQLQLRDLAIDGSCLAHLRDKQSLAVLQLAETGVGDTALEHLVGLKQLARLDLRQTQLTDAGLETLAKLPALVHVDLTDSSVTDDGVKQFLQKRPQCKVVR